MLAQGDLVKKVAAMILFAALGLSAPVAAVAQVNSDSARQASQKRNQKRSHKELKAQNKELRKARKAMGKESKKRAAHHQGASSGIPPT